MSVGPAIPTASFPTDIWDGESPSRDDRGTKSSPDWQDWARIVSEVIAMQAYIKDLETRIGVLEAA
jgi:hypothetical protein